MLWLLVLGALLFVVLGLAIAKNPVRTASLIQSGQRRTFGSSLGGGPGSLRIVGVIFVLMGSFVAVMAGLGLIGVIDFDSF